MVSGISLSLHAQGQDPSLLHLQRSRCHGRRQPGSLACCLPHACQRLACPTCLAALTLRDLCCRLQIKPDGVHRGLVGDIIKRFEQRGYKLVGIKVGGSCLRTAAAAAAAAAASVPCLAPTWHDVLDRCARVGMVGTRTSVGGCEALCSCAVLCCAQTSMPASSWEVGGMGSKGIRLCNDQPAEGCRSAARGWEHCGAAANDKPPPHFRPFAPPS